LVEDFHPTLTGRVWLAILALTAVAHGGVVSRDWVAGKLSLKLDDGAEQIEWLSPVAIQVSRSFGAAPLNATKIAHEAIAPTFEDTNSTLTMKSKYLTVEIDRATAHMRIRSGETAVADQSIAVENGKATLRLTMKPNERAFGLAAGRQFFWTTAGYGVYTQKYAIDLKSGTIEAPGYAIEYEFYYGPTAKEIMEQRATVHPESEVKAEALDLMTPAKLPKQVSRLAETPIKTWDQMAALIRELNQWSLSGVVYPALDLNVFDSAPRDLKARANDLASLFPLIYRTSGEGGLDVATRQSWTPYLITYLREAYDRGYPLIRPLAMQFSRDAGQPLADDVFMLGDEILLAPMIAAGDRRSLKLPRGNWTDVRTNREYKGNQTIEVDAPAGRVPMFVRNGWIIPQARADRMELHYYPSLGGEFFLWEPDINENSQFHAAPAGDYVRVEVESQKRRTYEWVLHHTGVPKQVAEESGAYQHAASREAMKPGEWWHDDAQNNLHLMLRSEAKTDRIVNMSF
jgi:hypothetical protein